MLVTKLTCPGCGAPLGLADGQRFVICSYCNSSLRVDNSEPAAPATRLAIPPEEIERVKQLVLDGRSDDAYAHYAKLAGVSIEDASKAVDRLVFSALNRLLAQAPINWIGFALTAAIVGAAGAGLVWSILRGGWVFAIVGAVCALLAALQLRWFVPKAISTAVYRFGSKGRARVVRRTVLRKGFRRGGTLVLVQFEVSPARGGNPFVDEEPLLVRDENVSKLEPGNLIAVRYDEPERRRVFPVSPIQVLGRA